MNDIHLPRQSSIIRGHVTRGVRQHQSLVVCRVRNIHDDFRVQVSVRRHMATGSSLTFDRCAPALCVAAR